MAYEIETKVLDIDADNIKAKLISLGAVKKQETRLLVDWYQEIGTKEGSADWFLRIRSNSQGQHEVTWKGDPQTIGIAKVRREINFFIEEPEKLAELFKELGLEKYAYQEKDRTSFTLKDWLIEIDQYPNIPPFLEIEGNSEEHLKEAIKVLGLEDNKTWAKGERILIQEVYKLDWYNMRF